MPTSLPPNPSIRQLQKQAKDLLKAHRSGDFRVCETYRLTHRFAGATDQEMLQASVSLQETQYALALAYGFKGWKEMKAYVERSEGRPRILHIDDDPLVLEIYTDILEEADYDVTTARNGDTGIKALESNRYDLVLTDLRHPGVSGLGILKYLLERSPGTKCIIITGWPGPDSSEEAMDLGAFAFMTKPMKKTELLAAVRKALQFKKLEEERKTILVVEE